MKANRLRDDYLSGEGLFGTFIFPYREELERSRFFLKTMEELVDQSEREEVAALEKGVEKLTPEQQDEYWQWHYPFHWQEIFSNRIRAAFILQLCTFVEGELTEISRRIELIAQVPLSVGDLRGSTLSKARKYLQAFASIEKPNDSSWHILERIFDVRNVVVHEGGFAGRYRNHKQIVAFAKTVPGLSLQNDFVQVKREFCEFCLASVGMFCDELHGEYEAYRASMDALSKLDKKT